MGIISTGNLTTVLDKLARHAAEVVGDGKVVSSPNAGLLLANYDVLVPLATLILGLGDPDQEADLLRAAHDLVNGPPQLQSYLGGVWAPELDALDAHCRRFGYDTLDAYLTYLNAATGVLRAHEDFSIYLRHLSPRNLFTPANVVLMHVTVTGATTADFVHVAALDTAKYGPGQIKVLNTKTEGLTSTVLTFPKAQKNGADHSVVATVTVQTDGNLTGFDDTDLAFTDVLTTSATISGGVSTDTFDIVVVPDRSIAAA